MKIRLESSAFKEMAVERIYPKDFLADTLCEECIHLKEGEICGTISEIRLNGFCVIMKDIRTAGGYAVKVSNDCPLLKLHFELEGNYSYTGTAATEPLVVIPGGHFNILRFAKLDGFLNYPTKSRRTLEILFTDDFIKKIVGDDYHRILKHTDDSTGSQDSIFWKESRPIFAELQQNIQDIMQCKYCGLLKKAYLEAKITSLLIDFLIEVDEIEDAISDKKDLSNQDYAGVLKVEEYIQENLEHTMTISELSHIAGYNTSKLKQNFKKVFSITIFKYITKLRMEHATKLLQNEKLSVSETSYRVGYKNPQHFTVAFKKYYGFLPSSLTE